MEMNIFAVRPTVAGAAAGAKAGEFVAGILGSLLTVNKVRSTPDLVWISQVIELFFEAFKQLFGLQTNFKGELFITKCCVICFGAACG